MNIEGSSGIREPFPLLTDFPPQSQKTIQGLMRAAKEGVRTLQESERGETIVHEVVRLHDYKIFKLVFKNGTPFLNIPDAHGRTPLHQAALLGDYSLVLELLKSGAHHVVNLPDHQGITPLHAAVISNNVQMAELLLSFGAEESVNAVLTDFSTPLHSAVSRKNAQMVELLLEHGAAHSINAADSEGQTPKQLAIVTGCVSIVQLMFEKSEEARASLNQPDSIYHITDLQRAARNGNMEMKGLILFHSVEEEIKASTDAFFPEGERLSCLVPSERELLESLPIDQIFFPLTIAQNFAA